MSLSKSKRFEVFKRDNFTCRYCGKKPPAVVLEVDHVLPKCEGGEDDEFNLVTACFDCNRGKGKRQLIDNHVADLAEPNFDVTEERLDQLKAYYENLTEIEMVIDAYVEALDNYWWQELASLEDWGWKEKRLANLRRLLHQTDFYTLKDCMSIAFSNKPYWEPDSEKLWKYFCGIAWNRIRER